MLPREVRLLLVDDDPSSIFERVRGHVDNLRFSDTAEVLGARET